MSRRGSGAEGAGRFSVSRAALLVTALTAASTLLGLLRDVVIGAVYGAGPELDAYLVAQGLMSIVLGLVADAVSRSVTPRVAREAAAESGHCRGHRGFDVALTVTLVALGLAGVIVGLLAGPVTSLIAPGFSAEQSDVAASLTRVMLLATVLVAGTDLLASLVQAHGRFAWSSLEGVPFNIIMIGAAALFGPQHGVVALAVGFVLGSGARLAMQLPPVRRIGIPLRARVNLRDPGFLEIARLVPPMLIGTAVVNVNTLVDRAVGSTLQEGAITALSYGWRLIHLPETLVITALLVPLYPALSAAASDRGEVRGLVRQGMAVTVTVLTPLTVLLVLAARPVVDLAFGHGAFDSQAVTDTALAVAWYAPALIALGCRQIVVRASYAVGDAASPVVVAVLAMVLNVAGDLLLAPILGIAGIAAATTASLVLAAVLNIWLLHRRHRGVDLRAATGLLSRALGLGLLALAAGYAVSTASWMPGNLMPVQPDVGASTAAGVLGAVVIAAVVVAVYVLGLILLRAPERWVLARGVNLLRRGR